MHSDARTLSFQGRCNPAHCWQKVWSDLIVALVFHSNRCILKVFWEKAILGAKATEDVCDPTRDEAIALMAHARFPSHSLGTIS